MSELGGKEEKLASVVHDIENILNEIEDIELIKKEMKDVLRRIR